VIKTFDELINTLRAGGVINNLVYSIDENGRECLIDSEGYALCWKIKPMEFTFKETIALGTPTLPTLNIGIKDPDNKILISMELPFTDALLLKSAIKKLEHEYMEMSYDIANYVQMNSIHEKALDTLPKKNKKPSPLQNSEDERFIM